MQHLIHSIGTVHSPFSQKFGIPRQPNLVPAAQVCIDLHPEFTADCVRGLADFDYIWVHFLFHDAISEGWAPLVRPPRLGGKQKRGVFATRTPHRPNHLGLSLLKLERIDSQNGVKLYCSGADLLDQTPVFDIKPYLPFVEAQPQAAASFAQHSELLTVLWQPEIQKSLLPAALCALIEQSIAQDPRPAYQNLPERVYKMRVANVEVHFQIVQHTATVLCVEKISSHT